MGAFVDRLVRELELDPGTAAGLAASFLRATRADLLELQAAVRGGEAARLASLAHHVKGAAASLEVEPIRSRAETLEHQARAGQLAQAGTLLSGIEAELQRLEAEP